MTITFILSDDHLKYICSYLSAMHLSHLSQTCTNLRQRVSNFYLEFATDEQKLIGLSVVPFQGVPLTLRRLIEHLGALAPEACRKISEALKARGLVFYDLKFVDKASVLIDPDFLQVREKTKDKFDAASSNSMMVEAAKKHKDAEKVLILTCRMGNAETLMNLLSQSFDRIPLETALEILCCSTTTDECKAAALERLNSKLNRKLTWREALKIANSFQNGPEKSNVPSAAKSQALIDVIKSEDMPLDDAEQFADGISDTEWKNKALCYLIERAPLKKGLEILDRIPKESHYYNICLQTLATKALKSGLWEEASQIAERIPHPQIKSSILGEICISDKVPLDVAEKIAVKIPDKKIKSKVLGILALGEKVPLEKALELARKIPLKEWKSKTLYALSMRALLHESSWEKAFEIALPIPDPQTRSETLLRIALEMPKELKKEALNVALSIPDPLVQSNALFELAMNRGLLYDAALEIVHQIPDPNIRQRALSLFQVRMDSALSSLRLGAL